VESKVYRRQIKNQNLNCLLKQTKIIIDLNLEL